MIGRWWRSPAPVQPSLSSGIATTLAELVALRGASRGVRPDGRAHAPAAGPHRARLLGRGLEFAELRPYQPGDDVRSIDWRRTARRGRPFTKVFHDERERTVMLLVDAGASMRFGTRGAFKSVAAARAAAVLAWAAIDAGERVGGVVADGVEMWAVPAQRRPSAPLRLLNALVAATGPKPTPAPAATAGPAPFAAAVRTLGRLAPPGARCVLLGDFRTLDAEFERELARLADRRTLGFVHVFDPVEAAAPPPGLYPVVDAAGERLLDLRTNAAREAYSLRFRQRTSRLADVAHRFGAPLVALATDADPAEALGALAAAPRGVRARAAAITRPA